MYFVIILDDEECDEAVFRKMKGSVAYFGLPPIRSSPPDLNCPKPFILLPVNYSLVDIFSPSRKLIFSPTLLSVPN